MQFPDSLIIQSIEPHYLEAMYNSRLEFVEKALLEQDFRALEAISAIDKQNINFLIEKKNELSKELNNVDKIKSYLTD